MFDYYISLGYACPIAASMSKWGLRSFSGVFDWLITPDFSSVLHYIETDFKTFLLKENLERFDDRPWCFRDRQSGIEFIHDSDNFEKEYGRLKEKYERKIDRFLDKTKDKVCYFRSVHSESDYEYIVNNTDYIRCVVKKNNPKSEIVFLCSGDLTISKDFQFKYYKIPGIWSGITYVKTRSYFDHADEFMDFCRENYSSTKMIKNLCYDIENGDARSGLIERRYQTLTALLAYDFNGNVPSDKVMIYGAGVIGKELFKKLKDLTSVICFIEEDKWKVGSSIENIKIVSLDEIQTKDEVKVIVSAAYDFENVKKNLLNKFESDNIISLDEVLNLKF